MKHITRKLAIFVLACVALLSLIAFAACGEDNPNNNDNGSATGTYTVKVVGIDGAPYTSALVQPCEVDASGNLSTCYNGVATDDKGVAVLEIGKHITNNDADHMEIHLLNLPSYLTYTAPRMHKNEEVTITLKSNLKTPVSGTGTGSYETDAIGNVNLEMDPFVVGEGAYALKFTSADQLIFFEFQTDEEGVYKVYSVGNVDASVTQLTGTKATGIRNTGDPDYKNDNVSATDKNFSYEFEVSPSLIEQERGKGICYFEVSLENAADVNKDAIICFEFVKDYEEEKKPDVVDIKPKGTLEPFADQDKQYIDAELDGSFVPVKGDDGFYYVGTKKVIATLGTDEVKPQGLELSFVNIYKQGQTFTFSDGKTYANNYYPLVEAYSEAANSEGRYPLTDELIEFFQGYIAHISGVDWLETVLNTHLPEGKEWIIWCGYYYEAPPAAGTEDDPITLVDGTINVSVAAGESVYYAAYTRGVAVNCVFMSDSDNVLLTFYSAYLPDFALSAESEDGSFYCEATVPASSYYLFVFSSKDGKAAEYSVRVHIDEVNEPDGSMDNPFEIEWLGWQYGETTETDWTGAGAPVYYSYTVTEEDHVLYFYLGYDTTAILSVQGEDAVTGSTIYKTFDELVNGLSVSAGTVLTIEVGREDGIGEIKFGIFNAPLGTEDNPYTMETGEFTLDVPAGGHVYFTVFSFMAPSTFAISANSGNVKLETYTNPSNHEVYESVGDNFYAVVTTEAMEYFYFVFSTKDGNAATFTILVMEASVEPEEGTEENPKEVTFLGTYFDELSNPFDGIYYTYTATAQDEKLYFDWDANTSITVKIGDLFVSSTDPDDDDKWADGFAVSEGVQVTIIIGLNGFEPGVVSFTVSSEPFGSDTNPYMLKNGNIAISVEAGEMIFYSVIATSADMLYVITSDDTNVKAIWYNGLNFRDRTEVVSDEDGFLLEITVKENEMCYIVFTTKDGAAGEYSVFARSGKAPVLGSMDNPIVIDEFKTYTAEMLEVSNPMTGFTYPDAVNFVYTATEAIKLYFAEGENTEISIMWLEGIDTVHYLDREDWENGVSVPAGAVVTIIVATADYELGEVSFTISDAPIAG